MDEVKMLSEFDYVKIGKKDLLEFTINQSANNMKQITIEAIGMELVKNTENIKNIENTNNKGEDIMKILELYEERELKRIDRDTDMLCEKAKLSGEPAKIAKKIIKIAKEELVKKGIQDDLIAVAFYDTEEVKQEKEKILQAAKEERKMLKETIEEVKALLEITENFEQKMEVLKSYGIVTNGGTLSVI